MRLTDTRVFPLVLLFILSLGAAGSLFADEDHDDLLRFSTLLKVRYDASPNTGSVVISFEGVCDAGVDEKNTLYRIYRASSPIMRVQSLNHAEALEVFDSILPHEHLSPAEKSAVHFYIGQCKFYLGKYKKAMRSFILSKEDPRRRGQAESWIDRCLERVN